jgi:hypothetical protein
MLDLVKGAPARAEEALPAIGLDEVCYLAAKQVLAAPLLAERQAYQDDDAE